MTTSRNRAPRWLLGLLTLIIVALAVLSFAVSFVALRDLAARSGVPNDIAWAWPFIVDGLIVVAMLYVFTQQEGRAFAWGALILFAVISIGSNGMHTWITLDPSKGVAPLFAIFMGTVPPIALLTASDLLARILTASRATRAIVEDTVVDSHATPSEPTSTVVPLAAEVSAALAAPDTGQAIEGGKHDMAEIASSAVAEHGGNTTATVTPDVISSSTSDDLALASVAPIYEMASVLSATDNGPAIPNDPDGQVAWLVKRTENGGNMALETLVGCFEAAGLSLSKRTIQRRLADARSQHPEAFAS